MAESGGRFFLDSAAKKSGLGRVAGQEMSGATCADACAEPALEQCVVGCATQAGLGFVDFIEPAIFICLSALASGLTLGLMSLDTTGLEIIVAGGEEPERSRAEKLLPLRKRGNQLLCTLLLTNTLVNARLSIFLGNLTSGVVGGLLATALIVVFGEIIPQATCSRHALLVGASVVEPMRLVMVLLAPVCWPISKLLDSLLGDEIASGHTKREIEHLLRVQDTHDSPAGAEDGPRDARASARASRFITSTEKKLLGGVLALSEKTAGDVMTDFENIFMIDFSARLDFNAMREIYRSGYTRVPVCDRSRTNLVGVLNTKDLVLVDADDELPVRARANRAARTGRRALTASLISAPAHRRLRPNRAGGGDHGRVRPPDLHGEPLDSARRDAEHVQALPHAPRARAAAARGGGGR